MKRHFSNPGEALAEVTATRGLTDRKTSVKAAFITQADRRAKSPPWFPQPLEIPNRPKRKPPKQNEDVTIFL